MRGKRQNVCHNCRQHKIGCDGVKPACSQCQIIGRECGGYIQDLAIVQHQPTDRRPRPGKKINKPVQRSTLACDNSGSTGICAQKTSASVDQYQPTYDDCVAILVQHYIPKDEVPFLSHVAPSKSRICGGWVQALPHVSKGHVDFESIVSPAVRALTMSMMVSGTTRRQQYLNTYGSALQGIRRVLEEYSEPVGPTVAIASMCLALSEVLVPTSSDGYIVHLRGVAAMMQRRGPDAFRDGVAHLMFVGVRPLIIIDAIIRQKTTFLMDEHWQRLPFAIHRPHRMQMLLSHVTAIPPLLAITRVDDFDKQTVQAGMSEILKRLQSWEHSFLAEESPYQPVDPMLLDIQTDPRLLPSPCFAFLNVSHANSLTHCWAFRIVCLLQLLKLEASPAADYASSVEPERQVEVRDLCDKICRGLPYLLQKDMSLYGSMSSSYPLHVVSESLQTFQLEDRRLSGWCSAIKGQIQRQRIALYEDMPGSLPFT